MGVFAERAEDEMADERRRNEEPRERTHQADPAHAATDPRAAAQQEQVKADHDALEESARRVESSAGGSNARVGDAATDPAAARKQEQVKADHEALAASARRVEASVSPEVRDRPIEHTDLNAAGRSTGDADEARRNADIARDSARRVEASVESTESRIDDGRDRR